MANNEEFWPELEATGLFDKPIGPRRPPPQPIEILEENEESGGGLLNQPIEILEENEESGGGLLNQPIEILEENEESGAIEILEEYEESGGGRDEPPPPQPIEILEENEESGGGRDKPPPPYVCPNCNKLYVRYYHFFLRHMESCKEGGDGDARCKNGADNEEARCKNRADEDARGKNRANDEDARCKNGADEDARRKKRAHEDAHGKNRADEDKVVAASDVNEPLPPGEANEEIQGGGEAPEVAPAAAEGDEHIQQTGQFSSN